MESKIRTNKNRRGRAVRRSDAGHENDDQFTHRTRTEEGYRTHISARSNHSDRMLEAPLLTDNLEAQITIPDVNSYQLDEAGILNLSQLSKGGKKGSKGLRYPYDIRDRETSEFVEKPHVADNVSTCFGSGIEYDVYIQAYCKNHLWDAAVQQQDARLLKHIVRNLMPQLPAETLDECLALHYVVWIGELNKLAMEMIEYGCNIFSTDFRGDSVIHYCVKGCNLSFLKKMYAMHGNKVLSVLNNNHFNLTLTAAAEASDNKTYELLGVMEFLYLHGMSLESQDALGKTPLLWASRRGSLPIVQYLLSRGANLNHRDYMDRTVLHLSCASGDYPTIFTLCELGAIKMLLCRSNDDSSENTALRICWTTGQYSLGLTLAKCRLQKIIFNSCVIFRNSFAWYYWILSLLNLAIAVMTVFSLRIQIPSKFEFSHLELWWLVSWVFVQLVWLIAYVSNPGCLKKPVLHDQSSRCSMRAKRDAEQKPVLAHHPMSQQYRLNHIEREMGRLGCEIANLNKQYFMKSKRMPIEVERNHESYLSRIHSAREQTFRLLDRVALERRQTCSSDYLDIFFKESEDSPNFRRICITCQMLKPERAHHCSECCSCIDRFDHHCVWIDNCVGLRNQRSFFVFILLLVALMIYTLVALGHYYNLIVEARRSGAADSPSTVYSLKFTEICFFIAIANSIFNVLWMGFVGYLVFRTIKSILTNITFYEYIKKPAHVIRRYGENVNGICWEFSNLSIGQMCRNLYSYFSLDTRWDLSDFKAMAQSTNSDGLQLKRLSHSQNYKYNRVPNELA